MAGATKGKKHVNISGKATQIAGRRSMGHHWWLEQEEGEKNKYFRVPIKLKKRKRWDQRRR